jgi:coniferyl-aldehyde dehydrogenase
MKLTDAPTDLSLAFERQRAAWSAAPCPDWAERADRLRRLKRILVEHEAAISQAIDADFGGRPAIETELAEVWPSLEEIKGALRHGWVSSASSCPGTTRCTWRSGRWWRRWPPATARW